MLRAFHDRHNAQVFENSGARNCGDPSKVAKKNGLPHHTRETVMATTKLAPSIMPEELCNDLVAKSMDGEEVAVHEIRIWHQGLKSRISKDLVERTLGGVEQ